MSGQSAGAFEGVLNVYFKLVFVDDIMGVLEPVGLRRLGEASYSYGKAWRYKVEGMKGVYEVVQWDVQRSLLKTNITNPPVIEFIGPIFLLKYYPHPEEEVFEEFSVNEQVLRLSPYFNYGKSPYPLLNSAEEINPTLFNVGTLYILAEDALGIVRLGAYTQDRLVSISEEGVRVSNMLVVPPGGKDRNVPGWLLTWNFLEKMAETYRKVMGKPYAAVGGIGKGKVWSCRQEKCVEQETEEMKLKLLEFIFADRANHQVLEILKSQLESVEAATPITGVKPALLWIDGELRRSEGGGFPEVKSFLEK